MNKPPLISLLELIETSIKILWDDVLWKLGFRYQHLVGNLYHTHPYRPKLQNYSFFVHKDRTRGDFHPLYYTWIQTAKGAPWQHEHPPRDHCFICKQSWTYEEELMLICAGLILTKNASHGQAVVRIL